VELLQQLAKDDDTLVRSEVARNPNTPVQLLQQLAKDDDTLVRSEVARNPNTPVELLQQLAKDDHEVVRRAAKPTLIEKKLKSLLDY
jgi:ABC-type transporter MlaC component